MLRSFFCILMASLPYWALALDGVYLTGGPSRYHTTRYNLDALPIEDTLQEHIQAWLKTPKWIGHIGAGYVLSDDFTIAFDYAGWFPKEYQASAPRIFIPEKLTTPGTPPLQTVNNSKGLSHSRRQSTTSGGEELTDNPWKTPKTPARPKAPQKDNISPEASRTPSPTTNAIYHFAQAHQGPNLHFKWTALQPFARCKLYGIGTLGLLNQSLSLQENGTEIVKNDQWDITLAVGAGVQCRLFASLSFDMHYTSIIGHYTLAHTQTPIALTECNVWKIGLQWHL